MRPYPGGQTPVRRWLFFARAPGFVESIYFVVPRAAHLRPEDPQRDDGCKGRRLLRRVSLVKGTLSFTSSSISRRGRIEGSTDTNTPTALTFRSCDPARKRPLVGGK